METNHITKQDQLIGYLQQKAMEFKIKNLPDMAKHYNDMADKLRNNKYRLSLH